MSHPAGLHVTRSWHDVTGSWVIERKPDKNIEDKRRVELVFRNGTGYGSQALHDRAKGLVGRY